tara:strand:+ start:248 stop:433 length:186 start_codon:yes stop_codon:yes gene_type:complete
MKNDLSIKTMELLLEQYKKIIAGYKFQCAERARIAKLADELENEITEYHRTRPLWKRDWSK